MQAATYAEMYGGNRFADWERFTAVHKPIIAAAAGYTLGGGCELAMMCGLILATDTAVGESLTGQAAMLQVLANHVPHPESVPINALVAVPGTSLSTSS